MVNSFSSSSSSNVSICPSLISTFLMTSPSFLPVVSSNFSTQFSVCFSTQPLQMFYIDYVLMFLSFVCFLSSLVTIDSFSFSIISVFLIAYPFFFSLVTYFLDVWNSTVLILLLLIGILSIKLLIGLSFFLLIKLSFELF